MSSEGHGIINPRAAIAASLLDLVCSERTGDIGGAYARGDQVVVLTSRESLVEFMTWLRDDPRTQMGVLIDVTAVDWQGYPAEARAAVSPVADSNTFGWKEGGLPRFEVVYHLLSMPLRHRLRVKVPLPESDLAVPSLCGVWIAANWGERETWDMYGVRFEGHPELKRILLYEEFEGHPLRKDYPLRGYQPLVPMPELAGYAENETYR
jgi:NADH-quinone oxidoreductase subunit C